MRISFADHLRGRPVVDSSGRVLGEVDDLLVDGDTWSISGIRLKLRRDIAHDLGVRHGAFRAATIDVPSEAIQSAGGDAVVLRMDADRLPGLELDGGGAHPPSP